jgi:hypothetical protein
LSIQLEVEIQYLKKQAKWIFHYTIEVIRLRVTILSVVMTSVIMPSVVMLNLVALFTELLTTILG